MPNQPFEDLRRLAERLRTPYVGFTMQPWFKQHVLRSIPMRQEKSPLTNLIVNPPFEMFVLNRQKEPCLQWNDRDAMLRYVKRMERRRFFFRRRMR